jgi:WD40 repeat protein
MAVAFSPDGRTLASTSQRHDVVLWNVATGKPMQTLAGHAGPAPGAAFSADGTRLATTDAKNLRIWKAATLEQIDRHPQTLRALFRLGVAQNRERRFAEAEATLRRVSDLQHERGASALEISQTRKQIARALEGQGKLPVPAGHSSSVERAASDHPPPQTGEP